MSVLCVRHLTRYRYRREVGFGEHRMMLRPSEGHDQRLLSEHLAITPRPSALVHLHDVSGACVTVARFAARAAELTFESQVTLEHLPGHAFAGLEGEVPPFDGGVAYSADERTELAAALERRYPDPAGAVAGWARRFVRPSGATGLPGLLADMTGAIHAEFCYQGRLEKGARMPVETLGLRAGSCRDFALLMIEAARSLGLAARFVTGYIYNPAGGRRGLVGGGHTHAWARIYLPVCGWADFDPTNGVVGRQGLIRVAQATDPRQAVPLHGTYFGRASDFLAMDVEVEVIGEEGRKKSIPLARTARAA